jgi:outer membrane protein assembly factor BamB
MGRNLRAVAVVGGVIGLAGCWPMPGANPDRTSHNPFETTLDRDTVAGLTEQWRWTSPDGGPSDPVTSTAGVHVTGGATPGSGDCGWLVTLDPATGTTRWEVGLFEEELPCAVAQFRSVSEPWVIDVDGHQEVAASAELQYRVPASLMDVRERRTRRFDPATGQEVAAEPGFVAAVRDGDRLDSFVQLSQRVVPVQQVGVDGRAFDLAIGSAPERSLTLGAELVYAGGSGLLATEPGPFTSSPGVRAFSRTESRPGCGPITFPQFPSLAPEPLECPVWATATDGVATRPVLDAASGTLFSRTDAGTLYALDAATGAVRWTASGLGSGGAPAVAGDDVWVPTGDGRVLAFHRWGCGAATCDPSLPWHVDTGTGVPVSHVTVAGDVVYASSGGEVYATASCPSDACPVLWSGPGAGTPVVAAGRLYVIHDTDLVAYGL